MIILLNQIYILNIEVYEKQDAKAKLSFENIYNYLYVVRQKEKENSVQV